MDMLPVITKPTRITDTSATLIDNIFIGAGLPNEYGSGVITSDMSDHLPVLIRLNNVKQDLRVHHTVMYRRVNEDNIKALNDYLSEHN